MVVVVHRFFFNDTATTEIYTLSLHDALPIYIHNITKKGENFLDINVFSIKFAPLNETTSNTCRYFWHGFWQRVLALGRSEEHTSELQSRQYLVCRLLLEKKKSRYSIALGREK